MHGVYIINPTLIVIYANANAGEEYSEIYLFWTLLSVLTISLWGSKYMCCRT